MPVGAVPIVGILPWIQPGCNLEDDVHAIHRAIRGLGTDEKTLIRIICNRSRIHLQGVAVRYKEKYGETLEEAIKGDTSGNFRKILLGRIRPIDLVKVKAVKRATVDRAVTNGGRLVDVFCFSSNADIAGLKAMHPQLEEWVHKDTHLHFHKGLKFLLRCSRAELPWIDERQCDIDADILYKAGEGRIGTDEGTFIEILCNHSPWYNARINQVYALKHKHDLIKAIKSETSGDFERLLKGLVTTPYAYWADRLHHAMKGAGTDDATLVYIFSILDKNELAQVALLYQEKYKKSLAHVVQGDTSGHYLNALLELLKTQPHM